VSTVSLLKYRSAGKSVGNTCLQGKESEQWLATKDEEGVNIF
jgi:hypothetical protein